MLQNVIQIKSGITVHVDVSVKTRKNIMCAKKDSIWNPDACLWKNDKYLASLIDVLVITSDKVIETAKFVPTKAVLTKSASTNLCTWLTFLLITIALLIAISIYCHLRRCIAK